MRAGPEGSTGAGLTLIRPVFDAFVDSMTGEVRGRLAKEAGLLPSAPAEEVGRFGRAVGAMARPETGGGEAIGEVGGPARCAGMEKLKMEPVPSRLSTCECAILSST